MVEYKDPESGSPVTGILQPVTSFCAILSMVKQDKLLLVEKALLQYKSHGYVLVPVVVISDDDGADAEVLPFHLEQHKEHCKEDRRVGEETRWNERNEDRKGITDSYIR